MLNVRAEEKTITFKVTTKAGVTTPFAFPFKDNMPFCIKSIKWNYMVPQGVSDPSGYGWPKVPLEITVDTICDGETASPVIFNTPIVMRGVTGSVCNRSHLPVELCIQFVGLLVSGDISGLHDQQIAAYASLDNSQRGLLALPQLLGNVSGGMLSLPEISKPLPALATKETPLEDKVSLLIGDLFQAAITLKIPLENLPQLAEALIKKGWSR
jgi:hypothetical protein